MFDADTAYRYKAVITFQANRALANAPRNVFLPAEVRAMALEIASQRYPLWDAREVPPSHDLKMRLANAIRAELRARGWRQTTDKETGKRRWVASEVAILDADWFLPEADWSRDPYRILFGDDGGKTYPLMPGWPPFTPGQRHEYARRLEARYPQVCAAFEKLAGEVRPPREHASRWHRRQEIARTQLWGRYASELTDTMISIAGYDRRLAA